MILAELRIQDYKQFAGEHLITPDSQGVIAIVGANGAGKTTLFEAIEWCLYGPRAISNADVFPRGREGKPLVQVTLEHPGDGRRYVIERRLRGKTMQAQVWRDDQPEQILATGSAPVRAFVAEQLIGLRHDAFVSTFFTRQKELTFFGSLRATERRVMVGRLLGVEAVRIAQESIGLERSKMVNRAEGLAAQVEQEQRGVDFDAEISRAEEQAELASAQVASADAGYAAAQHLLNQANERADAVRNREQQDRQFADQISQIDGVAGRLQTEHSGIERELTRLDGEQTRREHLAPIAADAPVRQQAVEKWREELQRRNRRNELLARQEATGKELSTAIEAATGLVCDSRTPALADWNWDFELEPIDAIDLLIEVGGTIDAVATREEAHALGRSLQRNADLDRAKQELKKYEVALAKIEQQLDSLLSDESLDPALAQAEQELEAARKLEAAASSEAKQARANGQQLVPLLKSLQGKQFGDHCPTCGRDIEPGDADQVISTLNSQVANWNDLATKRDRDASQARKAIDDATAMRAKIHERQQLIATTRSRLENGRQVIRDKSTEVRILDEDVKSLLSSLGLTALPSRTDVDAAVARAKDLTAITQAMRGLEQRRAHIAHCNQTADGIRSSLNDLGQTNYDEAAHRAAEALLDEAHHAAAAITEIDLGLARIPELKQRHATLTSEIEANMQERTLASDARKAFGFDAAEVVAARASVAASTQRDRDAMTALHLAQTTLRERRTDLSGLKKEKARLADLFEESLRCRREADLLDRMYKEFAAFDQFVASRIGPRLAEQTSELLGLVTDGKYDRVDFDENYGIDIYDGFEEKFPLAEFSGGERDIVSLCARLALSQVIGSAAANPPSFLVLDEAFGALDRERRSQLLDLLGQLSEQTASFQQMFVISHVDDVRTSPIFSRVWRIVEDADGCSRIEDVTTTGLKSEE
jgi:exonuclease SbcC